MSTFGGGFPQEETRRHEKLLAYLSLLMGCRMFGDNCPCFLKTRSLLEVFRRRDIFTFSSVLVAKGNKERNKLY